MSVRIGGLQFRTWISVVLNISVNLLFGTTFTHRNMRGNLPLRTDGHLIGLALDRHLINTTISNLQELIYIEKPPGKEEYGIFLCILASKQQY